MNDMQQIAYASPCFDPQDVASPAFGHFMLADGYLISVRLTVHPERPADHYPDRGGWLCSAALHTYGGSDDDETVDFEKLGRPVPTSEWGEHEREIAQDAIGTALKGVGDRAFDPIFSRGELSIQVTLPLTAKEDAGLAESKRWRGYRG